MSHFPFLEICEASPVQVYSAAASLQTQQTAVKCRHLSMSGPNPQSRASSSRPRITKEDEAVLDNHDSALDDQCYNDTFSTVKELDIAKSPRTTQSS